MAEHELGIFARTFTRGSIESNLDAVEEYGLGVVQYNMACAGLSSLPDQIPCGLAERIRVAAAQRGVRIAAVSGTFNMIHPDLELRRAGLHRLRTLAGACAALGTGTITLCTGTRDPHDMWHGHAANCDPDAWTDLLASMEIAVSIAEEFDICLGIEPETANVVDGATRALLLLGELRSARLKIVIDAANLFSVEDLPRQCDILDEAFDLLGPYLVMAHAKDVQVVHGEIRRVAAGSGLLDYPHYLSLVRHARIPLVVHGLSEAEVPRSLAFLRATRVVATRS
jgi:sugar phosphate isomerase/epimerase